MPLSDTLSDAVDAIIAGLDDLPVTATYHRITLGAYVSATDSHGTTQVNTTITGVFYRSKADEQDWRKVVATDAKFLIPGSEVAFIPSETDKVTIAGVLYGIVRVARIPGDPAFILTLRSP